MRNLNGNIGRAGKQPGEEYFRVLPPIPSIPADVNDNRQPVGVGCLEYPSNSFNVVFVLEVHRGRGEMQFEALERPVLRAPIELL
jgi:hypothetical protein